MGWRRVAEQELPDSRPPTRQYLQAYADGVNAYIARAAAPSECRWSTPSSGCSPGTTVEEWTAGRLPRLAQGDGLGPQQQLRRRARPGPGSPGGRSRRSRSPSSSRPTPSTRTRRSSVPTSGLPARRRPPVARCRRSPRARAGARGRRRGLAPVTRSPLSPATSAVYASVQAALDSVPAAGRPRRRDRLQLLGRRRGADHHRQAAAGQRPAPRRPRMPGIWYQIGLHCRDRLGGLPVRRRRLHLRRDARRRHRPQPADIAWGLTNLAPDVSDFYLEKVTGDTYLRDGQQVPLADQHARRSRSPAATDGRSPSASTVHGPILSDVIDRRPSRVGATPLVPAVAAAATAYAVSLAWTGLTPNTHRRRDLRDRRGDRLHRLPARPRHFAVPSQNLVYADTRRQHRLPGAGPDPDPSTSVRRHPARLLAGAGLGPPVRLAGFRAVRPAAVGLRPARGLHRHRQHR